MKRMYHIVVSIAGLESRLRASNPNKDHGLWKILEENGRMLTYGETWAEVEKNKKLGYEVIPMCRHHDKKGKCLGHPVKEGGTL